MENDALQTAGQLSNEEAIAGTAAYVKDALLGAEGGHDWWHIERVWKTAQHIQAQEGGNALVVNLAALLHDIADAKFYDGDETVGQKKASDWLSKLSVEKGVKEAVLHIIANISYRHRYSSTGGYTLELKIVQDADRLDAMGAIGIARAFSYGGFKQRPFYDPQIPPEQYHSTVAYAQSAAPTINHFYEKLLLLKEGMHTEYGRQLAQGRHAYMEAYLQQFFAEWEGRL